MLTHEEIVDQLLKAHYTSHDGQTFSHPDNRRVVAVDEIGPDIDGWEGRVARLLQREALRTSAAWNRYVVLVIQAAPSLQLCRAAAAFSQRVDRCRRVALFAETAAAALPYTLPFLALTGAGVGLEVRQPDVADLVRSSLLSEVTASALLDQTVPITRLEQLALEQER